MKIIDIYYVNFSYYHLKGFHLRVVHGNQNGGLHDGKPYYEITSYGKFQKVTENSFLKVPFLSDLKFYLKWTGKELENLDLSIEHYKTTNCLADNEQVNYFLK